MIKNIIREVIDPDFSFYFDGDMFNANSGDYNNTIFTVFDDCYGYAHHYCSPVNNAEFQYIWSECEHIREEVDDLVNHWSNYKNIREIMQDYRLPYNPKNAHALKTWLDKTDDIEIICDYLTIKTGKKWDSLGVCGCCQGDYVEIIYCTANYSEDDAKILGDYAVGNAREYCVIDLDDDGDEIDRVYGYFVADSEAWRDDEIKNLVCDYAGIDPDETQLEMFDGYSQIATYRTA